MLRPRYRTVDRPIAIATITNGNATSVNCPAPVRLSRIPSNMMPKRSTVLAQKRTPFSMPSGRRSKLPSSMPSRIATMIALTGLFANPSTAIPNQSAVAAAAMDTTTASEMPAHHAGIFSSCINDLCPTVLNARDDTANRLMRRFPAGLSTGKMNL